MRWSGEAAGSFWRLRERARWLRFTDSCKGRGPSAPWKWCGRAWRCGDGPAAGKHFEGGSLFSGFRARLHAAARGQDEPVPDPRLGANVLGFRWIGLYFFSQLIDDDAQQIGFVAVVRSPNGLQEAAMGDRASAAGHQFPQQAKFLGREVHDFAAHGDHAFFEIQFQFLGGDQRLGFFLGGTPQGRANPREELLNAERFDDVVVGAGVEGGDLVFFGAADGEHNDGHGGGGANLAARLEAVHDGHVHVEDDEVRAVGAHARQGFLAVAGFKNGVAAGRERGAHHAADLRLIVHHENRAGFHGESSGARVWAPASRGKVKKKTEPWPSWLVTPIEPPWASTMALAIGRPMPVPCTR